MHVLNHCGTPKVTRAWRKLGNGATWTCSCGVQFRLFLQRGYAGDDWIWVQRGTT